MVDVWTHNSVIAATNRKQKMNNFQVNQIVNGKFGKFVILAFLTIGGEQCAQVKEYDTVTGKARRGEMALPLTALKA